MGGGRTTRSDAREQLVPKGEENGDPSCSPSHAFPRDDTVLLPGTIPSSSGAPTPLVVDGLSNGDSSGRDMTATSNKGLAASGSPQADPNDAPPGVAATSQLPLTSPRPPMPSAGGSSTIAAMEIQEALLPLQPAVTFEHPISLPRRRWMVFMFCLVAALLFADQNLLAPNLTAAANYFGLNEQQKDTLLGGALMAAFFAVGAPAALLVGWLTDRGDINRKTLLFWVVVVGETPCLLTYWVKEYWQFFLLRALTGVAVGGCFPLVFSLLGDLYPPGRRAAVSAVVQIATGIGLAAGQALSGSIGPATNWRVPFVVVAAPSLAVALLMLLTTQEPPRGAFEEALRERYAEGLGAYEGSISWSKVVVLLRCPSNALVILQGLPGSLPWGMVLTYFNDFLAQQKGFTVQAATVVLLFFAGGGAIGVIGGGAGGQWLYNKRKEYQALLAGGSVLAGIAPLYALINADLKRMGLGPTCVVAGLGGLVASVAGPNLRSVMLNVNEPETRGVALALQSMTDDLGKGLGPVLVAGLIHALGRQGAFNVATAGWVPCSIMLASLACCMRRDEAAMQARLMRASEAQAQSQEAAARATAAAAAGADGADDGGGPGSGITVVLPPGTPPYRSDGGAGFDGGAGAGGTIGAEADRLKAERRLAKVRLLDAADGGSSTSRSAAYSAAGPPARLALPLSSSAGELTAEEGRWGPYGIEARGSYDVRGPAVHAAAPTIAPAVAPRPPGPSGRPLRPDAAAEPRAVVAAEATIMEPPVSASASAPPPPSTAGMATATVTAAPQPGPDGQSYLYPHMTPYPQGDSVLGTFEGHVGALRPPAPPLAPALAEVGPAGVYTSTPSQSVATTAPELGWRGGGDGGDRGREGGAAVLQDTSSSGRPRGQPPLQGPGQGGTWEPGGFAAGPAAAAAPVSAPGGAQFDQSTEPEIGGGMGFRSAGRGSWGAVEPQPGAQEGHGGAPVWPRGVAASLEAFWGRPQDVASAPPPPSGPPGPPPPPLPPPASR